MGFGREGNRVTDEKSSPNHRVLFLSRGGDISGEQRQLLYLIRGLDRNRYTPVVLCTRGGRFQRELQALDVAHHLRPLAGWRKGKHLLLRYLDAAYVSAMVRRENIALVHCSDVWLGEYALRSARNAGIPSVLHVRAPLSRRQARKLRCHRATRVVVISKRVHMRLLQTGCVSEDRIVSIHDAVDSDVFKPTNPNSGVNILKQQCDTDGKILVGLVGRVEPSKNQLSFVKIAADVLGKTRQVAFFLIGEIKDRSYHAKIVRYLREHNLSDDVHFTGRREDIPQVLSGLDILVSLSGGSVRYEAMMCGVPVICAWSRRPEESDHIRHNETGFLIPERSREAVTAVLLNAIERDDLRRRIGDSARRWAQAHLDHCQLVRETQALYDELL